MQSAGLVLWLVAACACHPGQAPPRQGPPHSTPSRPRATLLALVRAAAALHHHPPRLPAHAHYHVAAGAPPPSAPQDASTQPQDAALPEVRARAKRGEAALAPLSPQQEAGAALGQGPPIASTFLRHARSGPRPYDVPRIDCPAAEDQMERFPCPSPDRMGRYRCIDDHVLCDGFIDCPDGEDEDRRQCMFYKTTKAHLDVLADAIIRWARGGK